MVLNANSRFWGKSRKNIYGKQFLISGDFPIPCENCTAQNEICSHGSDKQGLKIFLEGRKVFHRTAGILKFFNIFNAGKRGNFALYFLCVLDFPALRAGSVCLFPPGMDFSTSGQLDFLKLLNSFQTKPRRIFKPC